MVCSWNFIPAVLVARFLLVQAAHLQNITIQKDARLKIRNCGKSNDFQYNISTVEKVCLAVCGVDFTSPIQE